MRLPPLERMAMLPAIEYQEERDPPLELAHTFSVHDILLFIGFLRQQGVTFDTLPEVRKQMPNLYHRAHQLSHLGDRFLGRREDLLLTRTFKYNGQQVPYNHNKAPEIVAEFRRCYEQGYAIEYDILTREIKGLKLPLQWSFSEDCNEIDFTYIPFVRDILERRAYDPLAVRRSCNLRDTEKIKPRHISQCIVANRVSYDQATVAASFAAGIDYFAARREIEEYHDKLAVRIQRMLKSHAKVPAAMVRELRKTARGRDDCDLITIFLDHYEIPFIEYTSRHQLRKLAEQTLDQHFDLTHLEPRRSFVYHTPERSLDERCAEAFKRLYSWSRRNTLNETAFTASYKSPSNALYWKYRNWTDTLIAFYGLERISFKKLDSEDANHSARDIAQSLRLSDESFHTLAEKIGLPLIRRETRTFPFVHQEHATQILRRTQERFAEYNQ